MTSGDSSNWEQEKTLYPPALRRAVEHLLFTDLTERDNGRYDLEGNKMFALVQEVDTVDKHDRLPESHREYVDVQFLVAGTEKIVVSRRTPELPLSEDRFEQEDVSFYSQTNIESDIVLTPGMFVMLFPADVHRPGCSVAGGERIRKVVIKVHTSLLAE